MGNNSENRVGRIRRIIHYQVAAGLIGAGLGAFGTGFAVGLYQGFSVDDQMSKRYTCFQPSGTFPVTCYTRNMTSVSPDLVAKEGVAMDKEYGVTTAKEIAKDGAMAAGVGGILEAGVIFLGTGKRRKQIR